MIESLRPINNSYLIGFVKNKFPSINFEDVYIRIRVVNCQNSIVYIDDEMYLNDYEKILSYFNPKDNNLLIVKDKEFHDYLLSKGFLVHHSFFWHQLDDLLSFYKIKDDIKFIDKFASDYNYICLNRNSNIYRRKLIEKLNSSDLLTSGFVTSVEERKLLSNTILDKLKKDDLSHYISALKAGYERHTQFIKNVPCSSNVKNFVHISEKLSGHTVITSETEYANFITEKSFLFLFCKKMPIIFSRIPVIDILRKEGFDVFDDIIDHSYVELDWSDQIIKGIDANRNILSDKLIHLENEINQRTEKNFDYFLNKWFPNQLEKLTNTIYDWSQQ